MAAVSYWILWWFDAGCDSAQYFRDYLANGGGAEAGGIAAWPANVALTSEPYQYSIYGTYTGLGWAGKIAGVTDPAYIGGVDIADIAEVKGVASA